MSRGLINLPPRRSNIKPETADALKTQKRTIKNTMIKRDNLRLIFSGHLALFLSSIAVIIVSTLLQSLVTVLVYPLTQLATGGAVTDDHLEMVNIYIFGSNDFSIVLLEISAIFGLATIGKYLHTLIARFLGLKIKQTLCGRIFNTYLHNEFSFYQGQKQGVLINNLINETERVDNAVVFLLQYLNQIVMSAALIAVMIVLSWKISLAIMVLGVVVYLSIRKIVFEFSDKTGKKRVKIYQEVNTIAAETFNGIKQIKIFDSEEPVLKKMSEYLSAYTKLMIKFIALRRLPGPLIQSTVAVIVVIAVLFNMRLNLFDPIKVLPLFTTLSFVVMRLFMNLIELLTSHMNLVSYGASIDVVSEILSGKDVERRETKMTGDNNVKAVEKINDNIEIRNLGFSFTDGTPVLDMVNMKITCGSKVGIVGYSGSGKSTLMNILIGLLPIGQGEILIDGIDLRNLSLLSYRKRLGVVTQDVFVFYGTVAENIRIGMPTADDETITRAARMANAHNFIEKLPQKYDTIIGERGANLSGGECQRIAIARALVREPDILIFDEATSSLDKESERLISDSINSLGRDKTVIIVSHNLHVITRCDVIYVFDKGRIIESGTHEELMNMNGAYQSLFMDMQHES